MLDAFVVEDVVCAARVGAGTGVVETLSAAANVVSSSDRLRRVVLLAISGVDDATLDETKSESDLVERGETTVDGKLVVDVRESAGRAVDESV